MGLSQGKDEIFQQISAYTIKPDICGICKTLAAYARMIEALLLPNSDPTENHETSPKGPIHFPKGLYYSKSSPCPKYRIIGDLDPQGPKP